MNRLLVPLLVVVSTGCELGSAEIHSDADVLDSDQAQLATDAADRGCQVVLRSLDRIPAMGGYETKCTSAGCFFVWAGVLDVATTAKAGSKPYVLYKGIDATVWTKKLATAVTGGPAGSQRYAFRLETNTVASGMSLTSLQRARLDVAPYLRLANGARLFDHNRKPGDFDDYALTAENNWAIADDAPVCRPPPSNRAALDFQAGWRLAQHGALVPGGTAVLSYALERLPGCRGTHNGYPAWDTTAVVRFSPGGEQLERSVRTFDAPNGVPDLSTLHSTPFEFTVPPTATGAEVWFINTGIWCTPSYDSNDGANYRFEVVAPPAPAQWVGNVLASTTRDCVASQPPAEPLVLDDYIRERACGFLEAQVWAPGTTDAAAEHPERIAARAELTLDGVALAPQWLSFAGRVGNDYRYHFELPRDALYYGAKWSQLRYTLEFSTDGVNWLKDTTRTVVRDATWCNPAWGSCAL